MKKRLLAFALLSLAPCIAVAAETNAQPTKPDAPLIPKKKQSIPAKKVVKNSSKQKKRWTLNKIMYRVNGVNVTLKDLQQPRIKKEGGVYSPAEYFQEECYVQEAAQKKIIPSGKDIERQLVVFKSQAGIETDEELEQELKSTGLTLNNYKNQLGRIMSVDNLKRAEIIDKIVITAQKVKKYWKNNPEYNPESYKMNLCILSEDEYKPIEKELNDKRRVNTDKFNWIDLGWVEKDNIDPKYSFIDTLKLSEISKPIKVDNHYHIVRVAEKRQKQKKSLDSRYREIEVMLREQKLNKKLVQFEQNLQKRNNLIVLH